MIRDSRPRVLVVDDDDMMRLTASASLEAAGFEVVSAVDGASARALLERSAVDAVILDVIMPGEDGFSICAELRARPGWEHTPILMATGLDDIASIERAYAVGATDFIHKPFNCALLPHRVRNVLRSARTIVELRLAHEWVLRGEALEKALALNRAISDAVPDALLVVCEAGTVFGHNRAMLRLCGFGEGGPAGDILRAFLGQLEDATAMTSVLGAPRVAEASDLKLVDGRILERRGAPVRTEAGPPCGMVWSFRDVTAERRLEAERRVVSERMASLGRIVANVAHEINNPLAYVLMNLELLAERLGKPASGAGASEDAEMLRDALEGGERVREIVAGLRALSREPAEVHGPVDLGQLVDESARIIGRQLALRASLRTHYDPSALVWGNKARLGQVILNLLVNAVNAIPEGNASENRVEVDVATVGGEVRLTLSDTGTGIRAEDLGRIFDPFFTTKAVGEGTGLGLAISKGIIEGHGGSIDVVSTVGRGTSFTLRLPAAKSREEVQAPPGEARASSRARVVFVDDEPTFLRSVRRMLRGRHEVETFVSIAQALTWLGHNDADAIVCDLTMRDGTGMRFEEELAALRPELLPRLLFLSGGACSEEALAFLEETKTPLLHKPIRQAELLAAIDDALAKPRAGDLDSGSVIATSPASESRPRSIEPGGPRSRSGGERH